MRLIKPSVEFYGAVPTDYENALKFIEKCGRLCYKSEDKITEGSAEPFVRRLIKSGHLAMVEHSCFVVKCLMPRTIRFDVLHLAAGKYLNIAHVGEDLYVGGNLTAWAQAYERWGYDDFFDPFLLQYGDLFGFRVPYTAQLVWKACPHYEIPYELHRFSVKFTCNRAVSHELVRHRPPSFAQVSQRYVNYGGKEMEFITPQGYMSDKWTDEAAIAFEEHLKYSEKIYQKLLSEGLEPQRARAVLPNATAAEIVVTCDAAEWQHIKNLRTSPAADPEMQRAMSMLPWDEFLK